MYICIYVLVSLYVSECSLPQAVANECLLVRTKEFIAFQMKSNSAEHQLSFALEALWNAPANTRIEDLKSFKELTAAFQLKSNDLEAFGLHQPMHE